jgi:hypothetical protein
MKNEDILINDEILRTKLSYEEALSLCSVA